VTAFGQIGISTGITGGLNFATFGGSSVSSATTITQFAMGVYSEISFPLLPISIQPEVLYSVKGTKLYPSAIPAYVTSATIKVTTSYIDIPILIKYYLPSPIIKPFIFIGPSIGFLVSAKKEEEEIGVPGMVKNIEIDVKNETTSIDFGAVVGVGVKIPFAIIDFTLDARYNYGFTSTDKINSSETYNRVIAVYIGVGF
jgi:hypothetical protein